jgi:hypothetical protein
MVQRNSFRFKYTKVPTNDISSWCASGKKIFAWRAENENRRSLRLSFETRRTEFKNGVNMNKEQCIEAIPLLTYGVSITVADVTKEINIIFYLMRSNSIQFFINYVPSERPPLWSSSQSFWAIGPGFDSRPYKIFWEVGGLERGPFSLVRTTEELLEWKSSGSGLENRD